MIVALIKPGGSAKLDLPTSDWARAQGMYSHGLGRLFVALYRHTGLKFAYFMPERGEVPRILCSSKLVKRLEVDYGREGKEVIWIDCQDLPKVT